MIKKIKYFTRSIKSYLYFFIYPSIKIIKSGRNEKDISIKKIFINKIPYNIYLIKNGRIYTNTVSDTAYISKNTLIKEPSYQFRLNRKDQIINEKIHHNDVLKFGTPYLKKFFSKELISLLSGGASKKNYWHWMFDTLQKLSILEKSKFNIFKKYILLPSINQKFQIDTISALGIKKNNIVDSESNNHLEAKKIIATDHPINLENNPTKSISNVPAWVIKWLKKSFLKKRKKFNSPNKIYINRESPNRKIVNNDEVKQLLKKNNFKIINPENYTFFEQINFFYNAKIIVGMHGAGFTNIIFCKKRTKIIEFLTKSTGNQYKNLAKKCELNYSGMIEKNTFNKLKYQNFHINVNISKLKKLIAKTK